jgi:adenylosuccinate lyase
MNKQFVVKMLQAKHMGYEAMKEILPEGAMKRIEEIEKELVDIAKEYITTVMKAAGEDAGAASSTSGNKVRKVTID